MKTFKLLLGIVEVCFLPALIIIRQVLGFQLGMVHWLIAGSFFGLGLYNIKQFLESKKKDGEKDSIIPNNAIISSEIKLSEKYQFILNSYENWKNGYFDSFSDYYKKATTKNAPEVLTGVLLNDHSFNSFLDLCVEKRQPETQEIMYTISPSDFMITNKTLYVNTDVTQNHILAIPLCEIIEYKNKGVWMKSGIIRLKNGQEIHFKLGAVPDEKRLRELQEMLGCEQLMII